ncbi:hypothetical protein [Neorhizobium galegae]|jgi:hypothetical protein|uniref:Uncharacterized protein n=1 Tax=Neorhizobium galegae TaxID=399 RepID=A0A6A1TSE0_NEOGA|nr:hypothetical protein [Neorhizobium galegae]KAB1087399.1 hypothetical protein F4V91_13790 [Neorhizobium galegae]MCQ1850835.1 hypothetical protein [Neorhizobium galegae]
MVVPEMLALLRMRCRRTSASKPTMLSGINAPLFQKRYGRDIATSEQFRPHRYIITSLPATEAEVADQKPLRLLGGKGKNAIA